MSISFITPLHVIDAYRRRNWRTCHLSLIDVIQKNGCEWLVPEVVGPLGGFGDREGCTPIQVKGSPNRSRLRNIGLENASFDFVCFVDADMVMHPEVWEQALVACKQWKAYSPYSFISKPSREQTKEAINGFAYQWNVPIASPVPNLNLSGGISFFNKDYLNSIGGWDERFMLWGYEDLALNMLVHNTAKSFCDGATSVHLWHPVSKDATYKKGPSKVLYEKEYVGKDTDVILNRRKLKLPETDTLEYHIVDKCNLSCAYCAHYSNFHASNRKLSVDDIVAEWKPWATRIRPKVFNILGGEPTMHKDLVQIVKHAKDIWCGSTIRVITNGFKLKEHAALASELIGHELRISLHHGGEKDNELRLIGNGFANAGVNVLFVDHSNDQKAQWYKFYNLNEKGQLEPYEDNNQRASWRSCIAKRCHVLRDGRLFKCPQIAFSSTVGIEWPEFKRYQSCEVGGDVAEWLIREDEACCSHCPSSPQIISIAATMIKTTIL